MKQSCFKKLKLNFTFLMFDGFIVLDFAFGIFIDFIIFFIITFIIFNYYVIF